MARILITGSSDGLGLAAAQRLISQGHTVVLHARNPQRASDATTACPGAETVVTGDLSSLSETKALAAQVNNLGTFDAVIHNAGLFRGPLRKTSEGIPALAAVNTIAPYVLTALINRPKRLVFLSSEMHKYANKEEDLDDPLWKTRRRGLHNVMFAKAFARRWPEVRSNALDPGWVATKMGGSSAPESIDAAVESYVMLAVGEEAEKKSGCYFHPSKREGKPLEAAEDEKAQDRLLEVCAEFSGVRLP
ncbi:hypothetical protein COCMIDRAFT_38671 [Bipolaris oryzae ATCC 44560]|uniref:NAD(P)-binding protein n=1 Tax=Bipolaris oryzae ATCC 44560 TaxID=930090 RepID=W6YVG0_COCMI|nr:uncharacterized protein COCMIDRAFT_38671 [Bipolaris oryzae ATCC 44560]EUC43412.1 hypothetical protein COCMIDRAFT_38671 [Bipolaris oryzae ATCC 44560]